MSSATDRELLGLAVVIWLFLAGIVLVAVRLMLGRPLGLWRRRRRSRPK